MRILTGSQSSRKTVGNASKTIADELEQLTFVVQEQQEALVAAKDEMQQVKKLRSAMSSLKL